MSRLQPIKNQSVPILTKRIYASISANAKEVVFTRFPSGQFIAVAVLNWPEKNGKSHIWQKDDLYYN